jgi:hypothetical protein
METTQKPPSLAKVSVRFRPPPQNQGVTSLRRGLLPLLFCDCDKIVILDSFPEGNQQRRQILLIFYTVCPLQLQPSGQTQSGILPAGILPVDVGNVAGNENQYEKSLQSRHAGFFCHSSWVGIGRQGPTWPCLFHFSAARVALASSAPTKAGLILSASPSSFFARSRLPFL